MLTGRMWGICRSPAPIFNQLIGRCVVRQLGTANGIIKAQWQSLRQTYAKQNGPARARGVAARRPVGGRLLLGISIASSSPYCRYGTLRGRVGLVGPCVRNGWAWLGDGGRWYS